eukprot:NODE_9650_length_311_cov_55.702290_g7882_i0.p4 GENE.NODE_9650_length_311_cov_55.702290_g7882_i0~~NODE_9650_length_311_cov_55.702290_g7882_i0.p4  ORF type:complete len:50 (-),score=3.85 NODE_9650_length_311_cov_55.702290_g7882_i0:61-210(-)
MLAAGRPARVVALAGARKPCMCTNQKPTTPDTTGYPHERTPILFDWLTG